MKMQFGNGIYRIDSLQGQWNLCFFSPNALRFYQERRRPSPCVTNVPQGREAVYRREGEIATFEFENSVVNISEQGRLTVAIGGNRVLDMRFNEHGIIDGRDARGFSITNEDRPVYGLGERTGPLDKRGYDYINWNTDDPAAHVDTFKSLYQSIPFFMFFDPKWTAGVFLDNASKVHFDINKTDPSSVRVDYEDDACDLYFFFGTMPEVIANYTALTGRNPCPPKWALGPQQSRWSYPTKETVEAVIEGYRKADLPLSVVYLDIDYMDSYKDFTVDESKFPDIRNWLAELKEQGIHVVPILDAGVKAEQGYPIYDEGIANGYFSTLDGEVYHNEVWPGDSVFPAFLDPRVREWWSEKVNDFLELGFDGIWNDMNEPASFKGPLPLDVEMGAETPHSLAHNVYGHYMCMAGAEGFRKAGKPLFQLTRAGFAGTCKYSNTWCGDNQSIYEHMRLMLPQLMNMSLSGQSYIGVDIGGFGGDATPELVARWAIAAILNPLFRNHSALGTKAQEPYLLEGEYLEAYRHVLQVRERLIPYMYELLQAAEKDGVCVLRPLVYNYPNDKRVLNENTQIMLGNKYMLAPALFPGQERRSCYFPEDFVDFESGELYEKGDHVIDVSLRRIPLFVRKQ